MQAHVLVDLSKEQPTVEQEDILNIQNNLPKQ